MRFRLFLVAALLVLAGCKASGESDLDRGTGGTAPPPSSDGDDAGDCAAAAQKNTQDARVYYESNVYPVLRDDCLACHVQGGDASGTSFVLAGDIDADYPQVKTLTEREIAGYPYLLAKATAIAGHTAGVRFELDSPEADAIRHFADLLKGKVQEPEKCVDDDDPGGDTVEDGFLKGVTLLDNARTLNKASMIMLGRRATAVEEYAVSNGSEESLRLTLRRMMRGREFTEFLMTAANDRLLTNKFTRDAQLVAPEHDTSYYRFSVINWPGIMPIPDARSIEIYNEALAQEPLALLAYIVNNERDYREVLRADYTVFNSLTYRFFDVDRTGYVLLSDPATGESLPPPSSPEDWVAGRFSPGVGTGYYLDGSGARHPDALPYPHAGVLTTLPWLARWENTNTNGQRKRAKMVMKQFLGYDIELNASRPMDANALNDSENPTFSNPACTGCHKQLDPLAGAFQNWGYAGRFRLNEENYRPNVSYDRRDALNDGYKAETTTHCGEPVGEGGYCAGDLWYADRFPIGFVFQGDTDITVMPDDGPGRSGPHDGATLRWAASQLVADPRFATGTVEFWYEAVFNEEPLKPPADGDPEYEAKLLSYVAQQNLISDVADVFVKDNGHGRYNLKDLLVELFISDWFRADSITDEGSPTAAAHAGMGALLTPEQLERKMRSTLGIAWGDHALTETYNVIYGGLDSDVVVERTRQMNPIMANVIKRMVSEMACETVYREFIADSEKEEPSSHTMTLRPRYQRLLFRSYDGETPNDEAAIKRTIAHLHRVLWNDGASADDIQQSFELFRRFWEYESISDEEMRCPSDPRHTVLPRRAATREPAYPAVALRVWRDMLAYFLSDPLFLSE